LADFLYKTSLAVVPRLYVGLTALWFGSCRLEVFGRENLDKVLEQGSGVVPFWHYSVLYMLYHLRQYPGVAMVSASKDGEYIARIAELLGFETVRGSANRFGVRALKGLIDHVKKGKNAGIVADGSQGPALVVQPGVILLAAKSGMPILPIVWAVKRYKAFNSWDHTVLPMPFSRMALQYGDLMYVQPKPNSEQVEEYRKQLEITMKDMYEQLWQKFGKRDHAAGEK
jgi:lysophospholipid acyltransferase (LPLAT)-like uncharacterized protein